MTASAGQPCCLPDRRALPGGADAQASAHRVQPVSSRRAERRHASFAVLPGGEFLMGTDDPEGFPQDLEGPVRSVTVAAFRMAVTTVTNRQFTDFIGDTGYATDAEKFGWSYVFHLLLHPAARGAVMDAYLPEAPWWLAVRGATWASPDGPGSSTEEHGDHPVVHVSHQDALNYCEWAGARLPTESEWEYAARGGLDQARYPWGDHLTPSGQHRCNIWQGDFPRVNTGEDGHLGTAPARSFPPNGFGLYNMAGNVWELTADAWVDADGSISPDVRPIRGGSYLCHESYCNRYRVAARSRTTSDSSTGNTGFRLAADA